MKVISKDKKNIAPTLEMYLTDCKIRQAEPVFRYQGSLYAAIAKTESQQTSYTPPEHGIYCAEDFVPCFNLRCRTVRGVHKQAQVQPLYAEIHLYTQDPAYDY